MTVSLAHRLTALAACGLLLAAGGLLSACGGAAAPRPAPPADAIEAAEQAIAALADRDFAALAGLVHPAHGVRFSPYAMVILGEDITFTPEEVRNLPSDRRSRVWGLFDGSGEPIEMAFGEYYERFVYSADFAAAEQVSRDRRLGFGNSIDNIREVYPEATTVEYHFDGLDPEMGGMDWCSLRLVLEQYDGDWVLVGVVHDQWTI